MIGSYFEVATLLGVECGRLTPMPLSDTRTASVTVLHCSPRGFVLPQTRWAAAMAESMHVWDRPRSNGQIIDAKNDYGAASR
jgi:hypothetical protein